jgi:hypothetical protein
VGKIRCRKHGDSTGGPFCCRHVLAAAGGSGPRVELRSYHAESRITETAVFERRVYLCVACVDEFGIRATDVLDLLDEENEARIPWTCPACVKCFEEYERSFAR